MATHIEMHQLGEVALRAISHALSQGDEQGYKELWRKQTLLTHIAHATDHTVNARDEVNNNIAKCIEELEHTIIRCAMALHLLNE